MKKSREEYIEEILEHERKRKEKLGREKEEKLKSLYEEFNSNQKLYYELKRKYDSCLPLRVITRNKIHAEMNEVKRNLSKLNLQIEMIDKI